MPLTLEQTQTLISAAHDRARADGLRVTVAVVDEGGLLKALARMDGAPPLSAQIAEAKAVGAAGDSAGVGKLAAEIGGLLDEFVDAIFALETANRDHPEEGDILAEAKYVQTTVLPAMQAARDVADQLEKIVPDDLWPLPKYSEILFIK